MRILDLIEDKRVHLNRKVRFQIFSHIHNRTSLLIIPIDHR